LKTPLLSEARFEVASILLEGQTRSRWFDALAFEPSLNHPGEVGCRLNIACGQGAKGFGIHRVTGMRQSWAGRTSNWCD
jgi:hypothetical protein